MTPPNHLHEVTVAALITGYDQHWGPTQSQWLTTEVEKSFAIRLINPSTGKRSRTFLHAGKIDALAEKDGDKYLIEHKTTSDGIDEPSSPYWRRLSIDTQINGYMLAGAVSGVQIKGCLYDVIRKPEIRPKKLTMKEVSQLNVNLTYLDEPIDADDVRDLKLDPEYRETPNLYAIRLLKDIGSRPGWYFQRKLIYLSAKDIEEYAQELWLDAEDIRISRTQGDIRRNAQACNNFGRACEYLDLCSHGDSSKLIQIGVKHPELNLETDSDDLLTNTRINTFRTCRRKHHYRYELALAAQEPSEALTFGDLVHQHLAHWWDQWRQPVTAHVPEPHRNGQALHA